MDWHARYHRAALDGMRPLTLEERGAYQTLLDLMYDYGRAIPDDARWLAGWMGTSVRRWNAIRENLITKGKITANDGFISNSRALFEIEKSVKHLRNMREAGAKGGNKTAELKAKSNKNNDTAPSEAARVADSESQATLKLKTIHRQDSVVVAVADARDFKALVKEAQARAGEACNLTSGNVHHVADLRRLLDGGCDWELDVLPAIDRVAASFMARGKQFSSWAILADAAVDNRNKRLNGLPNPKPNGASNGNGKRSGLPTDEEWERALAEVERNAADRAKSAVALGYK